jgi:cytochrome c heme-lyase
MCPAAMNEMTWRKVQDWEQLHCEECKYPTLLKFEGKPHDLRYTPSRAIIL